jgi:hypothetical protein
MRSLPALVLFGSTASRLASASPIGNSSAVYDQHHTVGWEPIPNRRGSLNIIESCAFTILACTWSIQRLNLPRYSEPKRQLFIRRVGWFIICILAPEFILAHAIEHRRWVRECLRDLETNGFDVDNEIRWLPWKWPKVLRQWWGNEVPDEDGKLTRKHCYYGNMGGFVVLPMMHPSDQAVLRRDVRGKPVTIQELMTCLKTEFLPDSTYQRSDLPNVAPTAVATKETISKSTGSITNHEMGSGELRLDKTERTARLLTRLGLTKRDIDDKDKADLLATIVTVLQLFWLGLSLLTRLIQNLASSQLEIVTLAFAACALLTYLFNWDKPQHIKIPKKVILKQNTKNINTVIPLKHPLRFYDIIRHGSKPGSLRQARLRNDTVRPKQDFPLDMLTLLSFSMVLVGAIHLFAWNFSFPTRTESTCWRAAALASTIAPVVPLFLLYPIPILFSSISHIWHIWIRRGRTQRSAQEFAHIVVEAMRRFAHELMVEEGLEAGAQEIEDIVNAFENPKADISLYRHLFKKLKDMKFHVEGVREVSLLEKLSKFIILSEQFDAPFPGNFQRLAGLILGLKDSEFTPQVDATSHDSGSMYRQVDDILTYPALSYRERVDWYRSWMLRTFSLPVALLYTAARLMVMALTLTSFRAMPESVYWATWTRYMPLLQ